MTNLILGVLQLPEWTKMLKKFVQLWLKTNVTIKEIKELSGATWSLVHQILSEDLGMSTIAVKFVPVVQLLTVQQKEGHMEECHALKVQSQTDPDIFYEIITGDESCWYGYNPKSKP